MGNKVVNDVSNSTIHNPNSPLPQDWRWVRLGEAGRGVRRSLTVEQQILLCLSIRWLQRETLGELAKLG